MSQRILEFTQFTIYITVTLLFNSLCLHYFLLANVADVKTCQYQFQVLIRIASLVFMKVSNIVN